MPGLGERWGRPKAEQIAVPIPKTSLMEMTEKIVRGLIYREDGGFVEPPYKIEAYVVGDQGAKVCKEILDKSGEVFKREPGLEIHRARLDGDERAEELYRDHLLATVQNLRNGFKAGSPERGDAFPCCSTHNQFSREASRTCSPNRTASDKRSGRGVYRSGGTNDTGASARKNAIGG